MNNNAAHLGKYVVVNNVPHKQVNEGDKKAYIRIADTINELAFIGGVNGNTLEQVLHYGIIPVLTQL